MTFLMVPGRISKHNTGSPIPGNSGDCNINSIAKGGFHISDMAGLIWKVGFLLYREQKLALLSSDARSYKEILYSPISPAELVEELRPGIVLN